MRLSLLISAALVIAACGDESGPATGGTATSGGTDGGTDGAADVFTPDGSTSDTVGAPDVPILDNEDATALEEVDAPDEPDVVDDVAQPPDEGPVNACDCDDFRPCTDDTCDEHGECVFTVRTDACLIANICYEAGWSHGDNACVQCDPTQSRTEWVLTPDGAPCGDDDACLEPGTCAQGQCEATFVTCNDGNDCTDDGCFPDVGCKHTPNFDACEDGDPCTVLDFCQLGECVPSLLPLVCNDGETCTNDACGPDGCVFIPRSGGCSDGTECTVDDFCEKGECESGPFLSCDDGNVCTVDKCDPFIGCNYELVASACCVTGLSVCDDQNPCTSDVCNEDEGTCTYTPNQATCDDGLPCTGPDSCLDQVCSGPPLDCDDGNDCTSDACNDALGGCQYTNIQADCDDDNACTANDACLGGTCTGTPAPCNDGDVCTKDSCHPVDGCTHQVLSTPCNDGNACTVDTVCGPDGCQGGPKNCDDDNDCTNDSCHPTAGCQHQPVANFCSDGLPCSTGDHCQSGQCIADTSNCGCLPDFSDVVTKVTNLQLGENGQPGQGLDVDTNPNTCVPADNCAQGIDNSMALFAAFANEPLGGGFQENDIILLFEHFNFKSTGQLYTLRVFPGDDVKNQGCNMSTEHCEYWADQDGFHPDTCAALIEFDNAKIIDGTKLTAGGPGYLFPLGIPLNDEVEIPVQIGNAQVQADVTIENGLVTSFHGVLAGAIPKETIVAGISQIPDNDLPDGLTKESLIQLVTILISNDIDTDNDGVKDSASIGLVITGISGSIKGIK